MEQDDPIATLTALLGRLPGIGARTARRLVHYLLRADRELMVHLAEALIDVEQRVHECPTCCILTATGGECAICADTRRTQSVICVVAHVSDQSAIEATAEYRGLYHVLHGTLSPLDGIGPDQLRIAPLMRRLTMRQDISEVILATPPTIDGEATALFLSRALTASGVLTTRIASGVPVGGELSYIDAPTLKKALAGRRSVRDGSDTQRG